MSVRRGIIIIALLSIIVALTGCAPELGEYEPIDPDNAGFWNKYFVLPLVKALDWFKDVLGNYGLSILAVTIIIRVVVLPLTIKQMKSQKAMQELQPELTKLREKYKKNQQKLQEETMKLFQKHDVNPLSGCFPILIQMPVLIAFYQAIIYNPHIAESSFLWVQLGQPDSTYLLPILAALTTYFQSLLMGTANNPQTRAFMWIMPIMIFVISINFPAALPLYWVYGNLFGMVQYYFIGKHYRVADATK